MPLSCAAYRCTNHNMMENKPGFFRLPNNNPDRRQKWITACKRQSRDGSPWNPIGKNVYLCGKHFIGGRPVKDPDHPDYVPSIFVYIQNDPDKDKNKVKSFESAKRRRKRIADSNLTESLNTSSVPDSPRPVIQKQCPSPVITDVGQAVTVIDTDQVVTAVGCNDEKLNSIHPSDATKVCVYGPSDFNVIQGKLRRSVKQTKTPISQIIPSKRSSQVMRKHRRLRRESTVSSVGNREIDLVTDTDSMSPNSKLAKSDANIMPHSVLQEATVFPQSTIAATQRDKRTLTIPNHQVAVMSNLLSMWKAGQLCDFYISNGTTDIMVHKMVLGAVCPKVLPILHNTSSGVTPKVTFPSYISKEGLLAFVEYMYSGLLDLDQDILVQLQTIAQILDMKNFEQLCSNELLKSKAASVLSAVVEPLLAEPCSLSGLLSSNTDLRNSQNTTLIPLLKLLENINNSNSSNSQGVVPTDNLTTVGGPLSSLSLPTLMSAPATTTADQAIDIKTELESDNETILTLNSQQMKMESCGPVRDQYGIQERLLIDYENITSNPRAGLQLASPSTNSGLFNIHNNMTTITDLSPTTSNYIPYPVGFFTSDGSKITPALQENCA